MGNATLTATTPVCITVVGIFHGLTDNKNEKELFVKKLFEPFFSTKLIGQGTGMGLAISRQIVDFHNGTLQFEPNGELGTIFLIDMPTSRFLA